MSKIYVGLNVNRLFADVANPREALDNLGLNIEDVQLLNGEGSESGDALIDIPIDREELITVSGLDLDQKKELYSLTRAVSRLNRTVTDISDINNSLSFNIRLNDQVRAGSIKYNFYDYADNTIKGADISTSRVSSWSGGIDDIFYGGEVEVVPNTSTGNTSNITFDTLGLTGQPEPLKFDGPDSPEVPTHLITLNVGGVNRDFYAIKGIPLTWTGFFQSANESNPHINFSDVTGSSGQGGNGFYGVVNQTGSALQRWVITNTESGQEFISTPGSDSFFFSDSQTKERRIDFYYNPDNIEKLGLAGLNISGLPNTTMPNLDYYNLRLNDLSEMPDFASFTPDLRVLLLSGNNMSRARDANGDQIPANTQLNDTLPVSLRRLEINGCFSDNTPIDISTTCPDLREFSMDSYYLSYSWRRMTDEGTTPEVADTIQSYSVRHQRYTRLARSVAESPNLRVFNIDNNNIVGQQSANTSSTTPENIVLVSNVLERIDSRSNSHNLIGVSGKNSIVRYVHQRSRNLTGNTSVNDINTIFGSNQNLDAISLYATDAFGTINGAFRNKGFDSIRHIDVRWTRMDGFLEDDSFDGCDTLYNLYISGGRYNTDDFFSASGGTNGGTGNVFSNLTQLRRLFVYGNNNMGGELPNFASNNLLFVIYINNTSFSGNIPLFSNNTSLRTLIARSSNFTGPVPSFSGSQFRNIQINNNNLSGIFSDTLLSCPNLHTLRVENNNLSGAFANFANCGRIRTLRAQNNDITTYNVGSLSTNTDLATLDLSGNKMTPSAITNLITDLNDNYAAKPRSGVSINIALNNPGGGNVTTSDLSPETNKIISNLTNFGWTIII